MAWNYRVLKENVDHEGEKLEIYRIIEVYYDDQWNINGWVDCTSTILQVVENPLNEEDEKHAYEDLKGSAEHVLEAFKLPVVVLGEDDKLVYELDQSGEEKK